MDQPLLQGIFFPHEWGSFQHVEAIGVRTDKKFNSCERPSIWVHVGMFRKK